MSHGTPVETTSNGLSAKSASAQPSIFATVSRESPASKKVGAPWVMRSSVLDAVRMTSTGTIPIPHSWRSKVAFALSG
ncbi:hypothetical protein D9M68_870810 [compost metagenome]